MYRNKSADPFNQKIWKNEPWWSVVLIGVICTISFALQFSRIGFYWDDYASIYVHIGRGSSFFSEWSIGQARPFKALFLPITWDAFGLDIVSWQIFHFVLYIMSVLLFWRILRILWSEYRAQTTLTALLFAVYPSYHLRSIQTSDEVIISLVVFLLSFWLSLIAARNRNIPLSLLAVLLIPIYQTIYEQNIAFEALRPLAMLYVMDVNWREWRTWLLVLLRLWFLAPVMTIGVLIYRFVLFEPIETYEGYNVPLYLDSISGWLLLLKRSITAPVEMLFLDWIQMPWRLFVHDGMDTDLPGLLATVALVACLVYLWRAGDEYLSRGWDILATSAAGFLMIGLLLFSVHMVGRAVSDGFNTRWVLSPSLMAALILGLAIPYVLGRWKGQIVLVILVISGVAIQVTINQVYIDDWELRRDLYWQMLWRAPEVAPETMHTLLTQPGTFAFDRVLPDYEFTTHADLYYANEDGDTLGMVGAGERGLRIMVERDLPRSGIWSEIVTGRRVLFQDWYFDLDKLLVFAYDGGCLRTANPDFSLQTIDDNATFSNFAPYHHPEQILDVSLAESSPSPYLYVVEPEPEHTWCFYYQQVQWALQFGHDAEAARLANEAQQHGFTPDDAVEWLPLIEAYNRTEQYLGAEKLVTRVSMADLYSQAVLCEQLKKNTPSEAIQSQIDMLPLCR